MGENPMTTSSQDFSDVSWSIQDDQAFDIMIRTATAVCKAFIQTYGAFGVTKFAIAISTAVSRLLEHQDVIIYTTVISVISRLMELQMLSNSIRCYKICNSCVHGCLRTSGVLGVTR